jgi:anti-sigma factor RsiW
MSGWFERARFRRDHRWAPARMSDYLDAELTPENRTRMERHLGECQDCRRLLAGLRRIVQGLHSLAAPGTGVHGVRIAVSVRTRLDDLG